MTTRTDFAQPGLVNITVSYCGNPHDVRAGDSTAYTVNYTAGFVVGKTLEYYMQRAVDQYGRHLQYQNASDSGCLHKPMVGSISIDAPYPGAGTYIAPPPPEWAQLLPLNQLPSDCPPFWYFLAPETPMTKPTFETCLDYTSMVVTPGRVFWMLGYPGYLD
ncbi:hypothetical protein [Chitinimonas naiadis]